jgi:hypothetical protein
MLQFDHALHKSCDIPAWTVLIAIFLFPFGLVALLARTRETVIIVAGDRNPGDARLLQ